ncbi:MAG: hypothetical protein AABW48_06165 [Nanoarchaeota archaeon]
MQKLKILNNHEVKKIKEIILRDYGYFPEENYAYLLSEKEKIFLVNKDVARIDLEKLRIDRVGLCFAEMKDGKIRLSKEGAQLLAQQGLEKLKNVVELTAAELKKYFLGEDLPKELGEESKFVLLKYKNDILGCAKYKEKNIINFLPKIHRGEVII